MAEPFYNDQLLLSIVEHLKLPLINIARKSELENSKDINVLAETSIRLIDGYILGLNVNSNQFEFEFEPVSISEVLNNSAHNLSKLAKIYDCNIELNLEGKFVPIMGRKAEIESAITIIGQSLIESNNTKSNQILLSAYRSGQKITAGVFSPTLDITSANLRKALTSGLKSRQGLPDFSHTPVSGIYIADILLDRLATKLGVYHHNKIMGLASSFLPSQQLRLI
jgi:hypothetical protein